MPIVHNIIKVICISIFVCFIILLINKWKFSYKIEDVYYDYHVEKLRDSGFQLVIEKRKGFFSDPAIFKKTIKSDSLVLLKENQDKGLIFIKSDDIDLKINLTKDSIRYLE